MQAYLDILDNILREGKNIRNNRTGIPDIGLSSGAVFEHDMSMGFPLLTTKKMGLKNIATELEFFIRGLTDKNGCKTETATFGTNGQTRYGSKKNII